MLVCLHICPFVNYYYPEIGWRTVELLQELDIQKVFVPENILETGKAEYERGNFKESKIKLNEFIEIFSDKYTIVLSHNTLDVVHFRNNYASLLAKTSNSSKAIFFEDKFAEISEFLLKISPLPFNISTPSSIGLILTYNGGVNSGINKSTVELLQIHDIDHYIWYLPAINSPIPELDKLKMMDLKNNIGEQEIDLIFNDIEALFYVDSFAKAQDLAWNCKHIVQLFEPNGK